MFFSQNVIVRNALVPIRYLIQMVTLLYCIQNPAKIVKHNINWRGGVISK